MTTDTAPPEKLKRRGTRGGAKKNKKPHQSDTPLDQPIKTEHETLAVSDSAPTQSVQSTDALFFIDKTPSQNNEDPSTTDFKPSGKKTRRGKRGGAGKKTEEPATEPSQTENTSTPPSEQPHETEPQHKKTRRSKRGKTADTPTDLSFLTGPNAVPTGEVGMEFEESGSGRRGDRDGGGSSFVRPEQPFFGMLSPEDQNYFKSMEKMLDDGDDPEVRMARDEAEEEQRNLLIQNMFTELENKELLTASDPECSRVMEKLLRHGNDYQIRLWSSHLEGHIPELFRHQFASHVMQTLLYLAADIIEREVKGESVVEPIDEERVAGLPTMQQLVLDMCESLKGQWTKLMSDPYGSHPLRALIHLLEGHQLSVEEDTKMRSKKSQKYNSQHKNNFTQTLPARKAKTEKRSIPESFKMQVGKIMEQIAGLHEAELRDLAVHPVANPVLQLLLTPENDNDHLIRAILRIGDTPLTELEPDRFVLTLLKHPVGSHILEKIVTVAPPPLFHALYVTYFRGKLIELCQDRVANFVVQRLVEGTKNATQVRVLVGEVEDGVGGLLFGNRSGVVIKLLEAAVKHNTAHKELIKALCAAFKTISNEEKKHFLGCALYLQPYEQYISYRNPKPILQGALLLSHLLSFPPEHNKLVIDSFMQTSADETFNYLFDPVSSRVVEAILMSNMVGDKLKRKMVRGYQGRFTEMSCDKYGSHMVDKCWAVADLKLKEEIAAELLEQESKLLQNFHGKFVHRNCKIDNFKRRRNEWIDSQSGIDRKKEMFSEFFGVEGGKKTKGGEKKQNGDVKDEEGAGEEEDPLWTTHLFDVGMAELGFGGGGGKKVKVEEGKKEKKGRREKKSSAVRDFEAIDKMALDDNEDGVGDAVDDEGIMIKSEPGAAIISKDSRDTIDGLFSNPGKRKRAIAEQATEINTEPVVKTEPETKPKKKKIDKDLEAVLGAVDATRSKKKKRKGVDEDQEEGKKVKKAKKKKFEG
ncbi:Nucleolar protein 9 [Rhizophlyctis rosea]|uniref:Nucleolar protein 9 n=1 Tax=Rhizophlyctis rosea TaxID=64517 RepID=A0AAD5X5B3_9FUNG|nr:Nucleolar protein 9 [Rhizophlyctis rosea]